MPQTLGRILVHFWTMNQQYIKTIMIKSFSLNWFTYLLGLPAGIIRGVGTDHIGRWSRIGGAQQ
jgi:hypothetical protein